MINEENFYNYNLLSLESILDDVLREKLLLKHYEEIDKIYAKFPDDVDYSKSILEACYEVECLESELISNYIAPGERLKYYLVKSQKKSLKKRTCMISSAIIEKGSLYASYKVFLTSLDSNKKFVSQEFITEAYTDFVFPETLMEFENFLDSLEKSYERDLENFYNIYVCNRGNIRLRSLK